MSDFKVRDRGLSRVFNELKPEEKVTSNDVEKLLDSASDGRGITKLEKDDLNWLLYKFQDNFTPDAKSKLAGALGLQSPNNLQMPSLYLRDKGLRNAFRTILADDKITKADVEKLLHSAKDGGRITTREKSELTMILNRISDKMDLGARTKLADAVGVSLPTPTAPTTPLKSVSELRGNPRGITDIKNFSETFRSDLEAAKSELVGHPSLTEDQKADRMFEFFKPYGKKFNSLSKEVGSAIAKKEMGEVTKALDEVGFNAVVDKDTDKDGISAAEEIMKGTDPDRFSMAADREVWTTTYWPMAGKAGNTDGSKKSNLWATDGALDQLDKLNNARGNQGGAKALEFERKPALNWLIGEADKGHYIPDSKLKENNAEITTGVDFDGDGRITEGVKVDFLDGQGNFAGVSSRNSFTPKIGDEVLTRKFEGVGDQKTVKYFHANGDEVTGANLDKVVLTNASADGKAGGTMDVGWWGSCDKVALAGILFEDPKKDVTLDGVTFTKQDIRGLLTVLADGQASGTDFVGSRYDEKPDILVTKDGKQISGKLITDDVAFETSDMWRWSGDYMVLNDVDKSIKFKDFATGEIHEVKASEVKHLAREDKKDMKASEFHHTMEDWLGSGRSAAMDRDPGSHVWNYNFHKAERAIASNPSNVAELRGYNGEVKNEENVKTFEMDVFFGESKWPKTYKYWIETDTAGKEVNSGWLSENPDFLWRPKGFNNWAGTNDRNPFVDPKLVKEIYEKSIN